MKPNCLSFNVSSLSQEARAELERAWAMSVDLQEERAERCAQEQMGDEEQVIKGQFYNQMFPFQVFFS